jgi:hypothetical protein
MKGQVHWDNFQWVYRYVARQPRPLNVVKTYGADTFRYGTDRDGLDRWWRQVIGGAAAVRFHRPEAGLGLAPAAAASIRAARRAEEVIKFWELEPANHLLSDREPDEAYLAAKPGTAYVLFFTDGGTVSVDLRDSPGTLDVRWINPATGDWGPKATLTGGTVAAITAPTTARWVAAIRTM